MTTNRRPLAASLTLITALICAGCTQSSASPVETTTTALPPPPPKTSAPPELTPEQQNKKAAEQAVVSLINTVNRVSSDPNAQLEDLATVSRGQSLKFWQESRFRQRAVGQTQNGEATVVPSQVEVQSAGFYQVSACLDVSEVAVTDADGESIVSSSREPRVLYNYSVEKTPEGFFVVEEAAAGTC